MKLNVQAWARGCGAAAAYAVKYKTDLCDVNLKTVQDYLRGGLFF